MFDAFLSYSRSDQAVVETVALHLRRFELNPFLDRWHLAAGQSWQQLLSQRLADCRSVVIFVGPSLMGSWQKREKEFALNRQAAEPGFPVIPVLLPGADDPALDFLGLNTWIDLRDVVVNPSAIEGLAAAIKGQLPVAKNTRPDPRAVICPYRGLQPFREEDSAFFFGRDSFTETLLAKLRSKRFLAVVGASGSGKSSVVRAGLVPRLRARTDQDSWDVLTIVPGAQPLNALVQAFDPPAAKLSRIQKIQSIKTGASGLRDGSVTLSDLAEANLKEQPGTARLLLVVDQFEELFTLVSGENLGDRDKFLDLLSQATEGNGRLNAIITLRGDFYARALSRRDLADRLQDAVINIGPLGTAGDPMNEIEQVIRKPAKAVGLGFEDGLVERILRDVGTEPGNLPLLEFLLTELWRRRKDGILTNGAYSELGGVEGAIAARADAALAELSATERRNAKRLMLMLVRPGQGQEDTRSRAIMPDNEDLQALVQHFADAKTRLLTTSLDDALGRTVEVSHEALIRNWKQLREWIDENRDRLRVRDRVRQRMQRWAEAGKPNTLLLPAGLDLEEGRDLLGQFEDLPVEDLRAFIDASVAAEQAHLAAIDAERNAEQERELRGQRQRRNIFAIAFLISLILLTIAGWQWQDANRAKLEALASALEANDERLKADEARVVADTARAAAEVAKLDALTGRNTALIKESQLLSAFARQELEKQDYANAIGLALRALPTPPNFNDRPRTPEPEQLLYDSYASIREIRRFRGQDAWVLGGLELKDGRILTWSNDRTARLWNAEGGVLATLSRHDGDVFGALALKDGRILTWSDDGTPLLWNAEGEVLASLSGHDGPVAGALELKDGRMLTWSTDHTARLWSAEGDFLVILASYEGPVQGASQLRDGRILMWGHRNIAILWSAGGALRATLVGHEQKIVGALELKSGRILTWGRDGTARLWSARGEPLRTVHAHEKAVMGALELTDGSFLTWSGGTARLWSSFGGGIMDLVAHEDLIFGALELKSGDVLTWSRDGTARLWRADGVALANLSLHEGPVLGALELDDGRILTWSEDGTARLWTAEGVAHATLARHEGWVWGALESKGGGILTWGDDGTVRLWSDEKAVHATLSSHGAHVFGAQQLSDGRLMTWSYDGARLWSAAGATLAILENEEDTMVGAQQLENGQILTLSNGAARLWSANGAAHTTFANNDNSLLGALEMKDSRILTWGNGHTARLWSAEGADLVTLAGHEDRVSGALELTESRILTWSFDRTARLWSSEGDPLATLSGHGSPVFGGLELTGGGILTWSIDSTARLWNADGILVSILDAHTDTIMGALELRDRRILTWSRDGTARLWDENGEVVALLSGHEEMVVGALELKGGPYTDVEQRWHRVALERQGDRACNSRQARRCNCRRTRTQGWPDPHMEPGYHGPTMERRWNCHHYPRG